MNKSLQQQYYAYLGSGMSDIADAYKSPSKAKREAWNKCLELCLNSGGYDIKIIYKNTFSFSVGYLSRRSGYTLFTYITKNNVRTATL